MGSKLVLVDCFGSFRRWFTKKSIFEYNLSIPDICYHKGSLNGNFEKTIDQAVHFEKQWYLMLGLDMSKDFPWRWVKIELRCICMDRHILEIFDAGREMGGLLTKQIHLRKYMALKTSCKLQAIPEMKVHKSRMFIVTFVRIKRDVKKIYWVAIIVSSDL